MPCGSVDNGGVHFGLQDFSVVLARYHPRYLSPLQYIRSKYVNLRMYKMVTFNVGAGYGGATGKTLHTRTSKIGGGN